MSARVAVLTRAAAIFLALAASARAEVHLALAHQYTRCTPCHYSPTGGGLLTPYGRMLSRQEISTLGRLASGVEPKQSGVREEAFLFGFLPREGLPIDAGFDLRPSQLRYYFPDGSSGKRDLWMRADGEVALRKGRWTAYGEMGRLTSSDGATFISREHWLSYAGKKGLGVRVGRFMPAFGIRNEDHSSYTRKALGFNQNDQIYGLELSDTSERQLVQFAVGGRAESLIEDDGGRAFTVASRSQWEVKDKHVLVMSGIVRSGSRNADASAIGGLAWGWAPRSHIVVWSELDALVTRGWKGTPQYTLATEASFEVYRGLWLKFAPQLATALYDVSGGQSRYALVAQFLPRTHWDLNLRYIRERDRIQDVAVGIVLMQCHFYM